MSTVLVVQSDKTLSQEWCDAVESAGHSVISACAMVDGIHRAREGGIDVVLLDHGPSDRGLEEFVTELDRLPDPPPFVLLSDSPQGPVISAHLGAAAFVLKPCQPDEIVAIVNRYSAAPGYGTGGSDAQKLMERFRLLIG